MHQSQQHPRRHFTAYGIRATGLARAAAEHLEAANDDCNRPPDTRGDLTEADLAEIDAGIRARALELRGGAS